MCPAERGRVMTPFGGAVTVLLMPFIAFRFGQALWDVAMLWRQLITARRVRRQLDGYLIVTGASFQPAARNA